jgi:hypothetical protein
MTKIKLLKRKDGTSWYADEAGKFFDPYKASKGSFVIIGEVQESDAPSTVVLEEKRSTTPVTPTLKQLRESQIKSYRAMGLSQAEAEAAAVVENKVLASDDPFAAMLGSLSSQKF